MDRNERATEILTAIIEEYIRTGEAVSSAAIAAKGKPRLSSASVRSIMAELTEQGYLDQPHISSGRIPTARAFRLYVDRILAPRPLPCRQQAALTQALDLEDNDISRVFRRASSLISSQCMQLGLVLAPRRHDLQWQSIEFSPINSGTVLAVLVLHGGLVRTRLVPVPLPYSQDELIRFSNYLNSSFKGCTLAEARQRIERELAIAGQELENMCRDALALSRPALELVEEEEREIFMDGIKEVSHTSAFADAARLRELLSFIAERPRIMDLLERTMLQNDISVSFIQGEYDASPWAVVSAPYATDNQMPLGVVSAVGLVQMDYAKVLPVVAHIARSLAATMRQRIDAV